MFALLRRWRKPPPQDSWNAAAYLRGKDLIIHASNRTYNNHGSNSEPVVKVSVDLPSFEIGSVVRSLLKASRSDAETPDPEGKNHPVLKAAGARNWDELERESRLVLIELRNDQITFYPMRATTGKEGRGFVGLEGAEVRKAKDCGDEELGIALWQALDSSIPRKSNR